jgi:phage tail-like protein
LEISVWNKEDFMAATGDRNDPYTVFNFQVEIDGVPVAAFSECSGLSTETEVIEYRNGNEDNTVRKLPGLKKFGNIVQRSSAISSSSVASPMAKNFGNGARR